MTGFAECAGRADAPLLRALLDHPAGAVRAAALAGLRPLEGPVDVERLLPLLDDPSASVAREAALCLLSSAVRLDAAPLEARLCADRPAHTRRAAFRLLRARGGAAALRASRALARDPDPSLRALALGPGG